MHPYALGFVLSVGLCAILIPPQLLTGSECLRDLPKKAFAISPSSGLKKKQSHNQPRQAPGPAPPWEDTGPG